jgi:hypothetical protein
MRHIMWFAILSGFTQLVTVAYAQSDSGTKSGAYSVGSNGSPHPGFMVDQRDPANCGTPDDQKPCGPMPRRALQTYPGR